jgi:hypothetical protein
MSGTTGNTVTIDPDVLATLIHEDWACVSAAGDQQNWYLKRQFLQESMNQIQANLDLVTAEFNEANSKYEAASASMKTAIQSVIDNYVAPAPAPDPPAEP